MKNSYRILGTSLLTLGLVGCFEVPDQDHLVTAQGIIPGANCQKPPLVALASTALPREFGITVWNLYKGQRKTGARGWTSMPNPRIWYCCRSRRPAPTCWNG